MKRLAKILYSINSITCIFIGLAHTYAHFTELNTTTLEQLLDHDIVVTGIETNIFGLWQGMSFMMGLLLIIIGLSHLLILKKVTQNQYPPIAGSLIMILMLLFVMYAGYHFFGGWQFYGGMVGLVIQVSCLILSWRDD